MIEEAEQGKNTEYTKLSYVKTMVKNVEGVTKAVWNTGAVPADLGH